MPQTSLRRNPRLRVPSGPDLGSPAALERPVSCQLSGYPFSRLRITHRRTHRLHSSDLPYHHADGLLVRRLGRSISSAAKHQFSALHCSESADSRVQALGPSVLDLPDLSSTRSSPLLPAISLGISIGRNAVFPAFLQQLPASRRMTVIRATKAIRKSSPYPYQSTLSQSYRRRSRASSGMSSPQDVKPVFPSYPSVLYRFFAPPLSIRKPRAVIGQNAHRIAPPFFDPSRLLSNLGRRRCKGPVPPGLESLVEHLHHNGQAPAANNSAVDSSGDAQMRPASETRGRLTGDPARIAEATRVYNQAHDLFVNHITMLGRPASSPASEPRAPTTDPIETDSEPADTQSEPLLTNDQGDPVSVTYPFTNFSRPTTPNPPGFFDPDDYHRLDDDQIHDLLRRDHAPGRFDRYAFGPQQLTDLYQSLCRRWSQLYSFSSTRRAECADRVQTFKFITRRYHSLDRVMRRR
ncbi:hypothetical protein PCASD_04552 [Puccinia coronata f. sp. avenae]|uniref:Uncharacterized protein n=1 Tax=Puccinia coronata f. sp. avenae TaxID=200324 RepID=A0A2N5V575_9BASI|nr:hypothetical protein PCASD_04552 [Puccinia coronata f. sp. avenae]